MLGLILLPGNCCFQFLTTDRNRNFVCMSTHMHTLTVFNLHGCIYVESHEVYTVSSNFVQTPQSLL